MRRSNAFITNQTQHQHVELLHLLAVARRFLQKKATISELRAAVRECEKIAAPTKTRDGGHEGK